MLYGPKHKKRERAAILDPITAELLTDENEILAATLQYNVGVLTKNKVVEQDKKEVDEKLALHEEIMSRKTKGENLSLETWHAVVKHIKQKKRICSDTLTKGEKILNMQCTCSCPTY